MTTILLYSDEEDKGVSDRCFGSRNAFSYSFIILTVALLLWLLRAL